MDIALLVDIGAVNVRYLTGRLRLTLLFCLSVVDASCARNADPVEHPVATSSRPAATIEPTLAILSGDASVRRDAFARIVKRWPLDRSAVLTMVESEATGRRLAAGFVLAKLATESEIPTLRRLLGDSDSRVRAMSLRTLVRLSDHEAVPGIINLAKTALYGELGLLADALVSLDLSAATSWTTQLGAHEAWANRRIAAQTAGKLDSTETDNLIIALLDDPIWMVQADAAEAAARRRLVEARSRCLELLSSREALVRRCSATCLGVVADPGDFERMAAIATKDSDKYVRIAAIQQMQNFGSRGLDVAAASAKNTSEHPKVRRAGLRVLAQADRSRFDALVAKGDAQLRAWAIDITVRPSPGR